jgi:hypothetical protein
MDNPYAMIAKPSFRQCGVNFRFLANQEKSRDPLIGLKRTNGAFYYHPTAMVSAHDIDGNAHKKCTG